MNTAALIGYTGFVGSNLLSQHTFQELYNSKNIENIKGKEFDLIVCCGVSAVKWLANQEPQNDIEQIEKLKACLAQINAKKFVLISTIDIYDNSKQANEETIPNQNQQDFYGKHRYQLEQWIAQKFHDHHILRLPGLFGKNIKKNIIFDILNPLAKSVNKNLWPQINSKLTEPQIAEIMQFYKEDEFGNLQLKNQISPEEKQRLIKIFSQANFSTLNFTDSRSSFQFYGLANLWSDIQFAIKNNIKIFNLATEPVTVSEIIAEVLQRDFVNHTANGAVNYDMYTKHAFDKSHYLYDKNTILKQINQFILEHK